MQLITKKCSGDWVHMGQLALRLALGSIFIYHGYAKLFVMGMPAVTGFMTSLGLPFPTLMAYLVSYGELVTGVLLIVGFAIFWVSIIDIIIASVAFLTVHMSKGFAVSSGGYEFIILILAASVSMLTTGAGKYSIDGMLEKKSETPQ